MDGGSPWTRVRQHPYFYMMLYGIVVLVIIIIIILLFLLGVNVWTGIEVANLNPTINTPDVVVNPPNIIVDPALTCNVNVSCPLNCTRGNGGCRQWLYAVPFVCGLSMGAAGSHPLVAVEEYAFTMSVFNPNDENVTFDKKISMTYPPGRQVAGPVIPSFPNDFLDTYEALEMSCVQIRNLTQQLKRSVDINDVRQTALSKRDTGTFIKGIASVVCPKRLVVWGTQTSSRTSFLDPVRSDALTFDKEVVPGICLDFGPEIIIV